MSALALLLALSYPILAHVAVARGDARLMALAIVSLSAALLLPALVRGRPGAWLAALAIAALVSGAARWDATAFLLYVPPVALNLLAAFVFARTLGPGRVPLIEQFSRAMHEGRPLDPRIPPYARRLTVAWALLLAGLALVDLVLALVAVPGGVLARFGVAAPFTVPQTAWSWFANFLSWGLIGALFIAEWFWRKREFPVQEYGRFGDYARRLARVGPALWRAR